MAALVALGALTLLALAATHTVRPAVSRVSNCPASTGKPDIPPPPPLYIYLTNTRLVKPSKSLTTRQRRICVAAGGKIPICPTHQHYRYCTKTPVGTTVPGRPQRPGCDIRLIRHNSAIPAGDRGRSPLQRHYCNKFSFIANIRIVGTQFIAPLQ